MVEVISLDSGCITWDDNQIDRCHPPNKCYEIESRDDVELLQYTGLKDGKGVDIVEGDICTITFYNKDKEIMQVIWNDDRASFEFVDNSNDRWCVTKTIIEVIGNIYMNEDLLK